jgi:hypothetical protein
MNTNQLLEKPMAEIRKQLPQNHENWTWDSNHFPINMQSNLDFTDEHSNQHRNIHLTVRLRGIQPK